MYIVINKHKPHSLFMVTNTQKANPFTNAQQYQVHPLLEPQHYWQLEISIMD